VYFKIAAGGATEVTVQLSKAAGVFLLLSAIAGFCQYLLVPEKEAQVAPRHDNRTAHGFARLAIQPTE
jgi:hypothetical protein